MHFTKMHGQGNDFIVVGPRDEGADYPSLSRKMCDRHKGAGADGLIAVLPSGSADFRMRIFNADGSEPEMCGNGIRCAVKFFLEKSPLGQSGPPCDGEVAVSVETLAGPRHIVTVCSGGTVSDMTVDMGEPVLDPSEIPVDAGNGRAIGISVETEGRKWIATCVSMGNPHAVIFLEEDPETIDISVPGRAIETHPLFPNKTNVEFARVLGPDEIRMRVRGGGAERTVRQDGDPPPRRGRSADRMVRRR